MNQSALFVGRFENDDEDDGKNIVQVIKEFKKGEKLYVDFCLLFSNIGKYRKLINNERIESSNKVLKHTLKWFGEISRQRQFYDRRLNKNNTKINYEPFNGIHVFASQKRIDYSQRLLEFASLLNIKNTDSYLINVVSCFPFRIYKMRHMYLTDKGGDKVWKEDIYSDLEKQMLNSIINFSKVQSKDTPSINPKDWNFLPDVKNNKRNVQVLVTQ